MNFCPRCGAPLVSRVLEGRPRPVCSVCGHVIYLDPKVAAGAIFAQDGRVVLLRRAIEPGRGKWVFPGGYVDRGETVPGAAVRETREEVGLEVRPTGLLGVYSYPESIVVVVVYRAEVVGGRLQVGSECLEVGHFGDDDLPWQELAFTSTYDALRDFFGRQDHPGLRPSPWGMGAHDHGTGKGGHEQG